jgi:hypothetical protein
MRLSIVAIALLVAAGCAENRLPPPISHSTHRHNHPTEFYLNGYFRGANDVPRGPGSMRNVCTESESVPKGYFVYRDPKGPLQVSLPAQPRDIKGSDVNHYAMEQQVSTVRDGVTYVAGYTELFWGLYARRFDLLWSVPEKIAQNMHGHITRREGIVCGEFHGFDFDIAFDDGSGSARARAFYHFRSNYTGKTSDEFFVVVASLPAKAPLPKEADVFLGAFRPRTELSPTVASLR